MRALLVALAVAAAVGLAGTSGAAATPVNATAIRNASTSNVILAQEGRCRCVERRWNGSCKLRVCRDKW
jgi:hypothetical protein